VCALGGRAQAPHSVLLDTARSYVSNKVQNSSYLTTRPCLSTCCYNLRGGFVKLELQLLVDTKKGGLPQGTPGQHSFFSVLVEAAHWDVHCPFPGTYIVVTIALPLLFLIVNEFYVTAGDKKYNWPLGHRSMSLDSLQDNLYLLPPGLVFIPTIACRMHLWFFLGYFPTCFLDELS
jgi:hypothetical protein